MPSAVAIDLGASSGRFAEGRLVNRRIEFEVIEQIPHAPKENLGRLEWDLNSLSGLAQRAVLYASSVKASSVGIDAWGVDFGFLDKTGKVIGNPVCYRDPSHARVFAAMAEHRNALYAETGIQHQPFNTIYQLVARAQEDPSILERTSGWLLLPDLLGSMLGGGANFELTEASTTQLMGQDGTWSPVAFNLAGWPVPKAEPKLPGTLGVVIQEGVKLAQVGSHDTASAVAGFGTLEDDTMFLNVGTWSLAGVVIPKPIATPEAEKAGFTNEWTVDGRVRFLKNIPGFYVINRLHEELGIQIPVPKWLAKGEAETDDRIDLMREEFFNPDSMLIACRKQLRAEPTSPEAWAGLALASLTQTISDQLPLLSHFIGRPIKKIRVGGGGSQSPKFCQVLANTSKCEILAGPAEVTVLGNLAVQFLAQGVLSSWQEMYETLDRSVNVLAFHPQ